ncbi:redox-regulated ATPase YchF [soil metagenome]
MNLSIAIVGLPNVGKSTLFNALLKQQVALAANYPFATIEPNVGMVPVPDKRLAELAKVVNSTKLVPAVVEFVDVAGLVKGASKGEGLGNQFLSHIRETMAVCHVLRGFADPDIIREGSVDPQTDLDIIRTELQLADLSTLEKQKQPKGSPTPAEAKRWSTVEKFLKTLNEGKMVHAAIESEDEKLIAKELSLLTAKPELFAVNVSEGDVSKQQELQGEFATKLHARPEQVIIISAKIESELSSLTAEDQEMFLADLGLKESGLDRLIFAAYQTLGLQSFLTAGEKEVRAWTVKKGAIAVEAAGEIHTDFMKKFIKANIAHYPDFIDAGGWKNVRDQGKMRQEGKEYIMQEGDVVEFMIGS